MSDPSEKPVASTGFFCLNVGKLFFLITFSVFILEAQISLPDSGEENEKGEEEEQIPTVDMPEEPDEAELQRLINDLSRQGRIPFVGMPEPVQTATNDNELNTQIVRYTTAPESLKISFQLKSGKELWGRLKNQSFKVKNSSGEFPVLFHEIKSMKLVDESETLRISFTSGDRLIGVPDLELISLQLPNGGVRELRISEILEANVFSEE